MATLPRVRLALLAALALPLLVPAASAQAAATLTRSGSTTVTDTFTGDGTAEQLAARVINRRFLDVDAIYTASSGVTESIADCVPTLGGVTCDTPPDRIVVNGGDGGDTIVFESSGGRLGGGTTGTINGGAGNDTITGSSLDDAIHGDGGNDTVTPGRGADTITCDISAGSDAVSYDDGRTDRVVVDLLDPGPDGTQGIDHDGTTGEVVPPDCDILIGSANNDFLVGDNTINTIVGGAGNDSIDALGGNDTVIPGLGQDGEVFGGTGDDTVSYDDGRTSGVIVSLVVSPISDGDSGEDLKSFENLIGSDHNDILGGEGGVNEINGGLGDDEIAGGEGADVLDGDGGNDTITCADRPGPVTILNLTTDVGCEAGEATPETENAIGSPLGDTLTGDGNANRLDGGAGNDSLIGSTGNDTILGGPGDDSPNGGAGGIDTMSYADGRSTAVTVDLSTDAGDDGDPGEDALEFENLIGGPGNDTLTGTSTANRIEGGLGNDTIRGGLGGDTVLGGGGGGDVIAYDESARTTGVVVDLANAAGADGDAGEQVSETEGVVGTIFADRLGGSAGNDVRIDGRGGDDTLRGNLGTDALDGGEGSDTVSYDDDARSAATPITVTLAPGGDSVDGAENPVNFEHAIGGPGPDTLVGNVEANGLAGRGGADILRGGGGADGLAGEGGDDSLDGGAAADELDGGEGTDTVSYASHPDAVAVTLGSGDGDDGSGFDGPDDGGRDLLTALESVQGSPQGDSLAGDANANALSGGGGDDTLRGGLGGDTLTGGEGTDTATYSERGAGEPVTVALDGAANDGAAGEGDAVEVERLLGGDGSDALTGDGGVNALVGGGGNDTLTGLAGADTLDAGAGDDDVRARDGETDTVDCGEGGADKAELDPADQRSGCEQADVGVSDRDGDGIEDAQDCAPDDGAIKPGATEIKGNDVDENCDGIKEALPPPDADGDGQSVLTDCNDNDAKIKPGALEIVGNKVDENCDRIIAPFPLLESGIVNAFQSFPAFSRVITLTVTRLPAGATIVVSCSQKKDRRIKQKSKRSCAFGSKTIKIAKAAKERKLNSLFKNRKLAVGTVITVQVTAPNTIGKLQQFTVLRRKTQRKPLTCIAPGEKPRPC